MPKPTKGARMGGSAAHQKLILANLATALFEHGKITTTEAKARRLRPYAEKLISKACAGDLHNRRQVMTVIRDKSVVHTLFTEIGPRFVTRPGGYTRITKIGPRKGDNAPMAIIALVEALAEATVAEAEGATRRSAADRTGASAATATVVTPAAVDTPAGDGGSGDDAVVETVGGTVDASGGSELGATGADDDTVSGPTTTEVAEPGATAVGAETTDGDAPTA